MAKRWEIRWKSLNVTVSGEPEYPVDKVREFDDVQWKEYGVRATDDRNKYSIIIPYTSIYDIIILFDDEEIEI